MKINSFNFTPGLGITLLVVLTPIVAQAAEYFEQLGGRATPIMAPVSDRFGFLNADAIPSLISRLRDANPNIRLDAALDVGRLKESAKLVIIPQLVVLLKDPNANIRWSSYTAFSQLQMLRKHDSAITQDVVKAMLPVLQDSNRDVRNMSAVVLIVMGMQDLAKGQLPELLIQLKDPNPKVRSNAADVLARMEDLGESAVPQLRILLKDPVPTVRISAAYAVGGLGASVPGTSSELEQMCENDPDPDVRKAVSQALDTLHYIDHERIRGL